MRRVRFLLMAVALVAPAAAHAQGDWAAVKGQVVLPGGKAVPERKKLDITQDKQHCLSKGDILDETVVINPKSKGIKNVVVWLRPADPNPKAAFPKDKVHPSDAARKPATVTLDQPCCMFTPRVTIARVGDTLEVKNSSPVPHNFFWSSGGNGEYNVTIPAMGAWKKPDAIAAENVPIGYKCTIHPWMSGWVRVFDHPYFAVTDDDGKFEFKNAPPGKWNLVVWHEKVGFLGGAKGRLGTEQDIKGSTLELKPIEFDVTEVK